MWSRIERNAVSAGIQERAFKGLWLLVALSEVMDVFRRKARMKLVSSRAHHFSNIGLDQRFLPNQENLGQT